MKSLLKFVLLIALIIFPLNSFGQFKVDFKKKVINQTNSHANQAVDKGIDKSLDAVEKGAKDAATGDDPAAKDQAKDQPESFSSNANEKNKPDSKPDTKSAAQEQPELQSYSKYDFIPGEKIIFYEDFSQDAVGDFPALWNTNGSAEVVTTNLFPGSWMKFDCREAIWTDALITLPENYN